MLVGMIRRSTHWLAIGLALLGSVVAIVNEIAGFRRTGTVDWGHVALIVGVPASIYAIVATKQARG